MKKIFLIFSIFLVVFPSCETDFDVHAEWQEITVVYGLLDQSQDRQYIKINKAFLGENDALQMAQTADNINFLPENMEVKLYKLEGQDSAVVTLDTTTSLVKDDGLFAFGLSDNIIYTFDQQEDAFSLETGKAYILTIENKESGNFVHTNTELITLPQFNGESFLNLSTEAPFGFYNPNLADSAKFRSKTIKWACVGFNNAEIFQLDIRFNYKENNIEKFLIWRQPLVGYNSSMSTILRGEKFFNYLTNNLEDNNTVIRELPEKPIDVIMTIGTADLATYITLNTPFDGIVQDRPGFTNINNGLGLFSSRYIHELQGFDLADDTRDFLKDELNRNFQ